MWFMERFRTASASSGGGLGNTDKLLSMMLRALVENESNAIYELLSMLSLYFGKSILSIVHVESREVMVTTETATSIEGIKKVVQSVRVLEKTQYFLRNQKNNVWFRGEYDCVRTYPLTYGGMVRYVLLVEQKENITSPIDKALSLLVLATQLYASEKALEESYYVDGGTKLPNRDALLHVLHGVHEFRYVGMFFVRNTQEFLLKEGYTAFDKLLGRMVSECGSLFSKQLYRMSEDKFVVLLSGEMFECVSLMQNAMDVLVREVPELSCSATIVDLSLSDDLYKVLYACEKACRDATRDVVLVVRSVEDVEENPKEDVFVSGKYKEEEVMNVVAEEVFFAGETVTEDEALNTAEEDLNFVYDIPDIDDLQE